MIKVKNKSCLTPFILIVLPIVTSCGNYNIKDLESTLNDSVGKEYRGRLEGDEFTKIKTINDETVELERSRHDGCSYAFVVSRSTKIIYSWNYTKGREVCNKNYFKTGA